MQNKYLNKFMGLMLLTKPKFMQHSTPSLHCEYSNLPSVWAYQEVDENELQNKTEKINLSIADIDRIIEMAWEDRTSFDAIKLQFGISEQEVIKLMRKNMKQSSFKMWRARVQGRATKHAQKRNFVEGRFKCSLQKTITYNKISKR
jgi:uncharacterized protein (TIGR03643 family)